MTLQFTGITCLVLNQFCYLINFATISTKKHTAEEISPYRYLGAKSCFQIWYRNENNDKKFSPTAALIQLAMCHRDKDKGQEDCKHTGILQKYSLCYQGMHLCSSLCSPCIPVRKSFYRFHKFWASLDLPLLL